MRNGIEDTHTHASRMSAEIFGWWWWFEVNMFTVAARVCVTERERDTSK